MVQHWNSTTLVLRVKLRNRVGLLLYPDSLNPASARESHKANTSRHQRGDVIQLKDDSGAARRATSECDFVCCGHLVRGEKVLDNGVNVRPPTKV